MSSPDDGAGRSGYLPAIDGLRAFAVVAVLLFHGGVLPGGYLGVDAFFVVSGFLITRLMLDEILRHGRLDLPAFWYRRVRRLFPALGLMLLGVAVYCATLATESELARIRGDVVATVLYVANWRAILADHGYWEMFRAPSPLEHTWSLAVEEQFYVAWPLVVAMIVGGLTLLRRRSDRGVAAPVVFFVAIVAAVSSAVWGIVLYSPARSSRVYLGTDVRIASILLGAALAAWIAWRGSVRSRAGRVALEGAAVAAAAGLGVAWASLDGQSAFLYRGGLPLCGAAVVVLVAALAHPRSGPLARALSWRPLVAVGLVSYGLYLWHWPVYVVLDPERSGLNGVGLLAARLAATTAAALASYVLVEGPVRRRAVTAPVFWPAVVGAAALCIGAVVVATSGAPSGVPASIEASRGPARVVFGADPGAGARDQQVLFLGDSVAGLIADQAIAHESEFGVRVVAASAPGCLLTRAEATRSTLDGSVSSAAPTRCEPVWSEGLTRADPGHLFVFYGNAASYNDVLIDGRWLGPCDSAYQEWFADGLHAILDARVASTDIHVATVAPVVGIGSDEANTRVGCINDAIRAVAREIPGVDTIDLGALECPGGACRDEIDGKPFRIDPVHPSAEASLYLERAILSSTVGFTVG